MEILLKLANSGKNLNVFKKNINNSGLKIKELDNLFLFYKDKNIANNDFTNDIIKELDGVIIDKNNLKIVCYSVNYNYYDINLLKLNNELLHVSILLEGSLIRVYYYNNKWNYSTKKCIDAKTTYWISNKNYYELFYDSINGFDLESILNINYCYSFLLIHSENDVVIRCKEKMLYHLNTYDITTLTIVDKCYLNVPNIKYIPYYTIDGNNIIQHINNRKNNIVYDSIGLLITDSENRKYKIMDESYVQLKTLWGNTNNRFMRYLELRKDIELLKSYLSYFKEDKELFIDFENRVNKYSYILLEVYIAKYIKRTNILIPYYMKKIIYMLHGDFIKTSIKTDFGKIMMKFLEIDAKFLLFMITHHNRAEENIKNIQSSTVIDYDTTYLDIDDNMKDE